MAVKPTPLSLALWASASMGASMAHAGQLQPMLQPMQSSSPPQPVTFTPMAGSGSAVPVVSLTAMEAVSTTTLTALTAMEAISTTTPTALTAMEAVSTTTPTTLVAMETRATRAPIAPLRSLAPHIAPVSITYRPMRVAPPDADVTLTPLAREGGPEVMHGRTNPRTSNPVEPIFAIAPPLIITPTGIKPLVFKKLKHKPVIAASGATSGAEGGFFSNPLARITGGPHGPALLTDTELSPNPNIPTHTRPEDEILALGVTINGIHRNMLLEAYLDDDQTLWLPFSTLAQMFEIPASVNAAAGVAQGWYQSPSNTFVINMAQGKATVGAQSHATAGQIEKQSTDLYLTPTALKEWFGITTHLDYNQLEIAFTTPAPLPGDTRARRLEEWDEVTKKRLRNAMPSDTIIPGYSNFSIPVLRVGTSGNFNSAPGSDAAYSTGLTLQAQNDIFGTQSNVTLAFSRDSEGNAELSGGSILLQKRSEKNDLLGPLHANYFGIGDINANPVPLSNGPSSGRGFRASNTPAGTVTDPDQYVLTGPAPIGWDAEVYQNKALVAFQHIDNTGTYRFNALPLKSGRNIFRIVLYGPNGEVDERNETIYLGDNIPNRGEWRYDASIFQPGANMIPGLTNTASGTALTTQAQFTTGLSTNWAATVGAYQTTGDISHPHDGITPAQQGAGVGLRGSIGGTYLTTDAFTSNGGTALRSTLRTPLTESIDLRLAQSRNMGFDPLERSELTTTEGQIGVPFSLGKAHFGTSYGLTRTTYQNQAPNNSFVQRTSVGYGKLNATNELTVRSQAGNRQTMGNLESAVHVFKRSVTMGLTYLPESPDPLRELTLNTQLPVGDAQSINLGYTQQLMGARTAGINASMYWNNGPYSVGVQGRATSAGNIGAGLNIATALVPQGPGLTSDKPILGQLAETRWKLAPPNSILGQGQASVRVYVDDNNNNTYDPGEQVLPNVTVSNRRRGTSAKTNAEGIARITDLIPGSLTRIEIDITTLPDIYLKPVSNTLNVKPHTGDNGILNYAMQVFGEISGQATTSAGQPVENLPVALFDASGKQVDSTTTEYDGYYTFGALPIGTYTLATTNPEPTSVTLTAKSRVKTQNLVIK